MAHLSLALLGPLRIALDQRLLTAFESDKVRALLIYLVLEAERPQQRGTLAELFWPGQPERVARHNLSQALFTLRQTLDDPRAQPPFLLTTRATVQFNSASDHSVDTTTFGALIAASEAHRHRRVQSCATCAEHLAAAIDLYQGDFLAQFSLPDTVTFEEWSLLKRDELRHAALEALTTLATYHELRGDYGRARELAQRQLALEPWHESAYRQLMRVLALAGQRTAALAAYERCRQLLADQLDVDPDDETTRLYERIRNAEDDMLAGGEHFVLPTSQPSNLPAQLTPFVGREHELVQIADLLANPQCRLITLLGPGGVGKTRLAHQVAMDQLEVFPDGVFFVPLEHLRVPELLTTAIANVLGLQLQAADDPGSQLLDFLQRTELLLLLDTFEHLLAAAQWLSLLLRSAPGVTLLVTSRERLDVQGEWLVDVGGLAVSDNEDGSLIEQSDAGQLWLRTAQRVQAGYWLEPDDRPCIARICRMVEGMPLAIELAAAWVRLLACHEIAAEIANGLALLTTTSRDIAERHRSLRAVLDHSWQLLNEDEQRILRQLSVFRGGLERNAAAQLMGASIDHLVALVGKSLLRSHAPSARERRYDLHELVRQYAFEQLELAGETAQTRTRHLAYFLELAEQAATHLTGAEQARWMLRLEAEHGNLRAALEWAWQSRQAEPAARLCTALWRFWQTRGHFAEGRQWIARVLQMADQGPQSRDGSADVLDPAAGADVSMTRLSRAHILKGGGVLAWAQSDYVEATAMFETSLALYRTLDDTDGIAAVSSNLGVLALYQGRYEQASRLFQASLALRRDLHDTWGTAVCLNNLGATAGKQGNLTLAQGYYEEALGLYRQLGYERGIAVLLGNLGDVAEDRGDVDRAHAFSTEGLAMMRKLGDKTGTASALARLGLLALRRNDVAEAHSSYAESLALAQALGDKEHVAIGLEGFAAIAAAHGRWERAARLWGAAEAIRAAIHVPFPTGLRSEYDRDIHLAQVHLGEQAFASAWVAGQSMSWEQAAGYALEPDIANWG